ncbi:Sugar lactone lactonase YvrE [Amycolatopsis pretoriensis]|uniref:Sugar lactone lactonase YvrE n=1 Tax=Amycolatopsis pretoriensis TaxID=218821 RepID=A0A1H5RFY4_9PSEU|nr:SMP-30/gluconolactonase/LRE family protein [Amycolatopsis pretoriensis]SEF37235.1 Sugar lactone lactonase YvrE [Amycolatopsis pretoriensis]
MLSGRHVTLIPVDGHGPEDVVLDAEGRIYTGVDDGRVLRFTPDGSGWEVIADTGGRPLGLELYGDDELLICDARAGLLVVPLAGGTPSVLATSALGLDFVFCNNAAVASDGTVYFTDSSRRFGIDNWRDDLIEQTGGGRLLRRTPDGSIDLVLDGLQFANGVALAPDESFVAVAETGAFSVSRVSLSDGRVDPLVENLWGFPDNISTGTDGLIWVTQASPRVAALDVVRRLPAFVRAGVRALPTWLQPKPGREVGVLGVSPEGKVERELRGEIDGFHMLVGVREWQGQLYFGSLEESKIAVTRL